MTKSVCLFLVAVALWMCGTPTSTPCPTPVATSCATAEAQLTELWTPIMRLEATIAWVETLAAEMLPTCGALWDCCANATLAAETPQATCEPQPTYTPYPTATEPPVLCRRCIANQPMPYNCPSGYFCKDCALGKSLCVRVSSPGADCNYCLGLVIP